MNLNLLQLRHIKLENNENKPVTNSRDTQVIAIVHKSLPICKKLKQIGKRLNVYISNSRRFFQTREGRC